MAVTTATSNAGDPRQPPTHRQDRCERSRADCHATSSSPHLGKTDDELADAADDVVAVDRDLADPGRWPTTMSKAMPLR